MSIILRINTDNYSDFLGGLKPAEINDALISSLERIAKEWRHKFDNPKAMSGAEAIFHKLVEIGKSDQKVQLQARSLFGLAKVNSRMGNEHLKIKYALDALGVYSTDKKPTWSNFSLPILIRLFLGNARVADRVERYREAYALAKGIGNRDLMAQACVGLGNARAADGVERYREAYALAKGIGNSIMQIKALIGVGRACRDSTEKTKAYTEALRLAKITRNPGLIRKAEQALKSWMNYLRTKGRK